MTNLCEALAKAQLEMKNPPKDKSVEINFNSGQKKKYSYTDLSTVIEHTKPILAKHGLTVIQILGFNDDQRLHWGLNTVLAHSSGETVDSFYPLPTNVTPQQLGSSLTYARRYSLCSLLNIAGEEDDDGTLAQETHKTQKDPTPPAPKAKSTVMNIVEIGNTIFEGGQYKGKSFKELVFKNKKMADDYRDQILKEKGLANAHLQEKSFIRYLEAIEKG